MANFQAPASTEWILGQPRQANARKLVVRFSGVRRCVRACVGGSNSTRPGHDQPFLFRRSNRPASAFFFFRSHKRAWLLSERSRAPPPTHNRFSRAANSRIYEHRACACMHARCSTSVRPSSARSFPAFHFAFRVVWCRGQSHSWGGFRIAVSSRARGSSAAPCPSSRPTMPPVLALLSSPS